MTNKNQMKTNNFVSEKWEQVYYTIPDDGSTIRFKDIVKELPKFSRSTISAALTYFSTTGLIKKEEKSKKVVEYSKTFIKIDRLNWTLNLVNELGCDEIEKNNFMILEAPRKTYNKILLNAKNEGKTETLNTLQALMLNNYLKTIEKWLVKALWDCANEPDHKKAVHEINTELQFFLLPYVKDMLTLVEDVGMDMSVFILLGLKERSDITKEDIERVKKNLEKKKRDST